MSFPPFPGRTTSKLFRERAEEARTLAETFGDTAARDQMHNIADGYDRMAEATRDRCQA